MNTIIVDEEYKIAATEVLDILEYLPKSTVNKIPNKFKEFLKENSNVDYKPNFDYSKGLDKIKLTHKTKLLLAMIYQNYICSEEEKINYNKILHENEEKYQKELREKYNPENIFKKDNKSNTNTNININEENNTYMIEYKENIFTKIKKIIFKLLHKNK